MKPMETPSENDLDPQTGRGLSAVTRSAFEEWAAYECYVRNAVDEGHQPWRWGVLSDEVKERFRKLAKSLVAAWVAGEETAREWRERPRPNGDNSAERRP
jgi:hypothetical protein